MEAMRRPSIAEENGMLGSERPCEACTEWWKIVDLGWSLNVCKSDLDMSHVAFYRSWRAPNKPLPTDENDRGQPGTTVNEITRFNDILAASDLVDIIDKMRSAGDPSPTPLTWRGDPRGKYGGKGMRIDYTLLSTSLVSRVISIDVVGHGAMRHGFLGSDHSPVILRMRRSGTGDS